MSAGGAVVGEPVLEGVSRIPGFVNCYVYRAGDETFLIDTGFWRRARSIVRAFREARVPITQVRRLLLTHHHIDHRGGAAYLQEQAHAPVSCHADDAPFVDGREKAPMSLWMRLFLHARPAPVATVLKEGDSVGPLTVLHTPGHTPGEVVFYDAARRLLFSGDAVVEHEGHLALPAPQYAANLAQAVQSLDRLRTLPIEVLLPGHGVPVTKRVPDLLSELVDHAPSEYLRPPPE
jgi:glyoxylase-like metal-dependent hydrolase (beta-lactamase superfamily II)